MNDKEKINLIAKALSEAWYSGSVSPKGKLVELKCDAKNGLNIIPEKEVHGILQNFEKADKLSVVEIPSNLTNSNEKNDNRNECFV